MAGAFETGKYRNVFAEYGYPEAEIQRRVEQTFETIFYGNEEERFYHEVGADMAYIEDTGNHDVRTEGMSYGMMACVQMNRREEFDRLWKWTRTYMYIEDGPCKNYFAWSCATDGSKNAEGPAPDGEEYFAMALFFAAGFHLFFLRCCLLPSPHARVCSVAKQYAYRICRDLSTICFS